MLVSDFHFDLPEDLIAQHPPAERGSSRMLVLDRASNTLTDANFQQLPAFLQPGDLLILNDSRVLPARLYATRAGLTTQANSPQPSGTIEVLLVEQLTASPLGSSSGLQLAINVSNDEGALAQGIALPVLPENLWRALVKPARKVLPGETLRFNDPAGTRTLSAEVIGTGDFGERTLRFEPCDPDDFYDRINRIGHLPLPPYIHRNQAAAPDTTEDRDRYQTVYSQKPGSHQPGSAAAPTAGLHFTPEILAALEARGVEIQYLTLHVGLGTFQPVRVDRLDEIRLHSERYTLPAATAAALNRARSENRRVIAVGTTTTRTLEHIARQLEPGHRTFEPHSGSTSIFLAPGHRFRVVSGLLTNFHLPASTLLMLVSAFAAPAANPDLGRQNILAAYAHAIHHRYRFYSYGDCMLLL
jgi:S-adenosylmethionine:tRNA ribosyltransferase-isomerase